MDTFEKELQSLLNKFSKENESSTPDSILAKYVEGCLATFNEAVRNREKWFGRNPDLNFRIKPKEPEPVLITRIAVPESNA